MRFYEINGGRDHRRRRRHPGHVKRGPLRSIFGMVLQDTWLFNGTIRDNIAYGREGATEEEIVQAAKAAHADHFIRTLPDGYDTVLNEEASNISQGQKQLLTIARAVLADPAILILDEATSNVDSRTEVLIQQAMARLMQGRTSFVIAHRLSTIRDAETDPGHEPRTHHRAGHPPRAAGAGRLLRRPVQQPVHRIGTGGGRCYGGHRVVNIQGDARGQDSQPALARHMVSLVATVPTFRRSAHPLGFRSGDGSYSLFPCSCPL